MSSFLFSFHLLSFRFWAARRSDSPSFVIFALFVVKILCALGALCGEKNPSRAAQCSGSEKRLFRFSLQPSAFSLQPSAFSV
jgi:hypothetical protein